MFRILNRYALREILTPAILSGVTLVFVLLIQAKAPWNSEERLLFTLLRVMFREGGDKRGALSILLLALPNIVFFVAPMALLLGVILGVGRMAMDLEVRAIQTSGANLFRVFLPIIGLGAALSACDIYFNYETAPRMLRGAVEKAAGLIAAEFTNLDAGRVYERLIPSRKGLYFYFDEKGPGGAMKGVTLLVEPEGWKENDAVAKKVRDSRSSRLDKLKRDWIAEKITREEYDARTAEIEKAKFDAAGSPMMIFASEANFDVDAEQGRLDLRLKDGSVHILAKDQADDQEYAVLNFKGFSKTETFASDKRIDNDDFRTTPEIMARTRDKTLKDKHRRGALAAALQRFSLALQFLVYAFIGLPLAIWMKPSGKSIGVVLAIGLIFIYHLLMGTGLTMVEKGVAIGPLVIFSPALLSASLGWALWRQALRS